MCPLFRNYRILTNFCYYIRALSDLLKESGLTPLDVEGKAVSLGLHDSFEAAAILAKALAEEKATTHS